MKNIFYIQHTGDLGGATYKLIELLNHIDKKKFNPSVIFLSNGEGVDIVKNLGIETRVHLNISTYANSEGAHYSFRTFRPWYPITKIFEIIPSTLRFYKILKKIDADLIHINTSTQIPSLLAAYFTRKKCIFHVREVLRRGNFGIRRKIIQLLIEKCSNKVICIAKHNADQIIKSKKVFTIYDSVNFKYFNPDISKNYFRSKNIKDYAGPLIGILGGILPHKGLHVLIKASEIIKKEIPESHFIVAGSMPRSKKVQPKTMKRKIRNQIARVFNIIDHEILINDLLDRHDVKNDFTFTGNTLKVNELIASLNVLVFPITESHFGNPILEAMSMKIPVVASDLPSTREIIKNNETGLLAIPNNHEDLAEKIIMILKNNNHANYMADNAFKYVKKNFNLHVNIKKIFNIYDELLNNEDV